jgi:pentatricopeptide repeat protein
VDEAMRLFSEMGLKGLDQNSVTYTVMISGLSKAGKSDEAFGLYDEMKRKGYTIDNKVYTALIGSMHSPET